MLLSFYQNVKSEGSGGVLPVEVGDTVVVLCGILEMALRSIPYPIPAPALQLLLKANSGESPTSTGHMGGLTLLPGTHGPITTQVRSVLDLTSITENSEFRP